MCRWLTVPAILLTSLTCGGPPIDAPDAGLDGGGVADAGGLDGGSDGGERDAAVDDAGGDDAAVADSGVDGGTAADASLADAGRDASSPGGASDGGWASFEACCAELGCADDSSTSTCAASEPAYGRCSIGGTAGVCVDTALCGGAWFPTAGYCPGPSQIQCCRPPTTGGACTGEERPLPNANISASIVDVTCPEGMRLVGGVTCVDVYEAFLVEVLPDGGTAGWSPYFNPGSKTMRAISAPGAVPQGYINGNQAQAACARAEKRLCTDVEWLRACRGSQDFTYPYGEARINGACNDSRSVHPAIEYFGADDPDPYSKIQHPCLNQLANGLDPTGANEACVTEDGLFDMMGNLHEWTADPAGTFRGGFYVDTRINDEGCLYRTTAHDRSHWDYSTGFRCCADPL